VARLQAFLLWLIFAVLLWIAFVVTALSSKLVNYPFPGNWF